MRLKRINRQKHRHFQSSLFHLYEATETSVQKSDTINDLRLVSETSILPRLIEHLLPENTHLQLPIPHANVISRLRLPTGI